MRTAFGILSASILGFAAACGGDAGDPVDTTGGAALSAIPKLPSPTGTGALSPWGGGNPATWRPEAIVANASSAALNEAFALPNVVDATAAVPVKMKDFGFEEFGDGQVEAAPSFETWKGTTPPLVAVLVKFGDGHLEARMRFAAATDTSVVVRTVVDGVEKIVTLAAARSGSDLTATWNVPAELGWDSTFSKSVALVRPASQTDWFPLAFRIPTRLSRDLDATIPASLRTYADGHDILDHEDVGLSHPNSEPTVLGRLQHHTFRIPYTTAVHPDLHGVFFDENRQRIVKAVGQGFGFTPTTAPIKLQYLCFEGRNAAHEAAAPNGGVPSGAGWHEMDDKPAETLVNDLEDESIPMGSAWTPMPASDVPSGGFAFGLSEVATLRLLRPGEAFITPRSGTTLDANGASVRRANYHRVYAGSTKAKCIEVWQHPCTPTDDMSFTCATAPVEFDANAPTANGEHVFVLGDAPELGGWDPTRAVPLDGGPSAWHGVVSIRESVALQFKFIKKDAAGHVTFETGANRAFEVPVAPSARVSGTFR
jgi:Starch binding domain